jgi:heat shock protein HslJ
MRRISALVVPFLLLASCGGADPTASGWETPSPSPAPDRPADYYDGTWELTEGEAPEGPLEITERWRITLAIDGKRFGGLSACNHYGLSAKVDGDAISISGVGGTEMSCHPRVAETEARYHSALMDAETISRSGDRLVLAGPESELVFQLVPPGPLRRLTDVRWELRSLIHGRGPSAPASPANPSHPAHLYIDGDGTVRADTGCRELVGEWLVERDMILFGTWGAKDSLDTDCPEKLREQSDAIIGLGDGFTYEIDGRTLTVFGRFSPTGLEFRAAR